MLAFGADCDIAPQEASLPKEVRGLISYLNFPLYVGKLVSQPKAKIWQDGGKQTQVAPEEV